MEKSFSVAYCRRFRIDRAHRVRLRKLAIRGRQVSLLLQKIAEFDDHGAKPGATVTHSVDFGGLKGKQKVLAVWNIADTSNAFYTCIDVNVG